MGNNISRSPRSSSITISSRNINCDRRGEKGGYAHEIFKLFALENRIDKIILQSIKDLPTIISYCEVNANSVDLFKQKLSDRFQTMSGAYSPNQMPDQSMYFVTAYDPLILTLEKSYMFWFTDAPTIPHTHETRQNDSVLKGANEQFEKGSLISIFKTQNKSFLIHSANHWGLRENYQTIGSKMLHSHLIGLTHHYKKVQIVISGDFNTFEQFENRPLNPIVNPINESEKFKHHIDVKTQLSFVGYPYDMGLKTNNETLIRLISENNENFTFGARKVFVDHVVQTYGGAITGLLDHVFTFGINDAEFKIDTCGLDVSEENLNEMFVRSGISGIPFMASDHLQTLITFQSK